MLTDRDNLIETAFNLGKDAMGIKPRWVKFDEMSIEAIEELCDHYADCIEQERFDRQQYEAEMKVLAAKRRRDNRYRPNRELAIKLGRATMRAS